MSIVTQLPLVSDDADLQRLELMQVCCATHPKLPVVVMTCKQITPLLATVQPAASCTASLLLLAKRHAAGKFCSGNRSGS